jgi:hypothetical protein
MPVNLWSFESGIYPSIDAAGMRGEDCVEMKKLALGLTKRGDGRFFLTSSHGTE